MLLRFGFSEILPNKISPALILKRKSCICWQKLCIAYFRRHMECAVLKRFLKVQGTFLKKFLQIPLFPLEKINLIRFIKTLIKGFTLFSYHLSLRDIFPTKGKTLKISQMDLQKMQWNCILPKVLLNFFQKIFRVWGETPRSFSPINLYYLKKITKYRKKPPIQKYRGFWYNFFI